MQFGIGISKKVNRQSVHKIDRRDSFVKIVELEAVRFCAFRYDFLQHGVSMLGKQSDLVCVCVSF